MTFSDKRVVDLVKSDWIPVWESVAPVTTATFDLGDGNRIRGTVGGEIALYFCRPDGKVFDILPALHSPHATYWAIRNALDFYKRTGATEEAVRGYHRDRLAGMTAVGKGILSPATAKTLQKTQTMKSATDPATREMAIMTGSKSGGFSAAEPITVVEPGGHDLYKRKVHGAFTAPEFPTKSGYKFTSMIVEDPSDPATAALLKIYDKGILPGRGETVTTVVPSGVENRTRPVSQVAAEEPLRTPAEWKSYLFETILDMPLRGGEVTYDVDTLAPMSIIED